MATLYKLKIQFCNKINIIGKVDFYTKHTLIIAKPDKLPKRIVDIDFYALSIVKTK